MTAERPQGFVSFLRQDWPVLVGIALGTLALVDDGVDGSEVTAQLAMVTLVMAAAYLPIGRQTPGRCPAIWRLPLAPRR